MKAVDILDYKVNDVFHIFIENAKKDFSDFNVEDATGCKVKKKLTSSMSAPIECTVEITKYKKNELYQITTSTENTTCVSTYTFQDTNDGKTKLMVEEKQDTIKFFGYMSLLIQRFMDRRNFKLKYNNLIENLNNQLKTYLNNIERSKPKNKH